MIGKLITLEGGECAGKGTHGELIKKALIQIGYSVNNKHWEPGSTPKSELIRIILKNKYDTKFEFPQGFFQDLDLNKYKYFFEQEQTPNVAKRYLQEALKTSDNTLKNEVINFILHGETKTNILQDLATEFMNYNNPAEEVFKTYLREEELKPRTQEYLFFAARNIIYTNHIEQSLKENDFTIIDRSLDSTTVYQGHVFNPERVEHIRAENQRAIQGVVPNLTLFLDIPIEEIYKRLEETDRGSYADYFDGKGKKFHEAVRTAYHEEMRYYEEIPITHPQHKRIQKINANKETQQVHQDIMKTIKQHFEI